MRSIIRTALLGTTICLAGSTAAQALPVLQLDIVGGHYDHTTQTIISAGPVFQLVAIFTPPPGITTQAQLNRAMQETVYIAAAANPAIGPADHNLGSFSFNGHTTRVTEDMTYGTPPVDLHDNSGADPGDLGAHDIYPTYFTEFAFHFNQAQRTVGYNTAQQPGGLTPNPTGTSYYQTFAVDTRQLDPRYVIHFDMYNETFKRCTAAPVPCVDVDVDQYAPFAKDAQSAPVPEPASLLLLGSAVAAGVIRKRKRSAQA
jgi:hypothetical protein